MALSTSYNSEIKKADVQEGGYQIASYDFNSGQLDIELGMSETKANECLALMEQAKEDHEYFVSMED